MMKTTPECSDKKPYPAGRGVAVGMALGTALGAAFDKLAIGVALGVAFGAAMDSWRSPDAVDETEKS